MYCGGFSEDTPYNSPLAFCDCISEDDYEDIYNHGLGSDCQGTASNLAQVGQLVDIPFDD